MEITSGPSDCVGVAWAFRDDNESYNHYSNNNWQGIISVVRTDMVNYAK